MYTEHPSPASASTPDTVTYPNPGSIPQSEIVLMNHQAEDECAPLYTEKSEKREKEVGMYIHTSYIPRMTFESARSSGGDGRAPTRRRSEGTARRLEMRPNGAPTLAKRASKPCCSYCDAFAVSKSPRVQETGRRDWPESRKGDGGGKKKRHVGRNHVVRFSNPRTFQVHKLSPIQQKEGKVTVTKAIDWRGRAMGSYQGLSGHCQELRDLLEYETFATFT
ncbi:hypothetical protein B0H12DRAFT_1074081 [Mycena haematopus]|nr:hypothetical protein B0H12DRAFT_1074081 [Mycena haematopus]